MDKKQKQSILDKLDDLVLSLISDVIKLKDTKLVQKILTIFSPVIKIISTIFRPIFKFVFLRVLYFIFGPIIFLFKKIIDLIFHNNKFDDIVIEETSGVGSDTFTKSEMSETDIAATNAAKQMIIDKAKNRNKLIRKILYVIIFILLIVFTILIIVNKNKKQEKTTEILKQVREVRKMNLTSELSGSGMLKPKDSYTITSLVEGQVIDVQFDVGDKVEKGQLLLTIDSSSAERSIVTASASLAQAKDSYDKAKKEYDEVEEDYSDNTFKSPYSGYLRTISIKNGDKINSKTEIATIIDDSVMTIKVPFLSTEAQYIRNGQMAYLILQETGEAITGVVKSVAKEKQVIDSGALVSYVTINCNNPGGLTTSNTAVGVVDGIYSLQDASFEVDINKTITFNDGEDVVVEKLLVDEGGYVKIGDPLFKVTDGTMINIISSKKNSYLSAKNNLIKAEASYEDALDDFNEYYITAPIEGTVISKNAKVGDKVQNKSSSTTTLAEIYDLSELTFDMDIDELDISNVKLGQSVVVQADAFNNQKFTGTITNISLVYSSSNGVTNYPVTVTITDTGSLMPGMNVDAYVILSEAEDATVIPSDALQRGNVVYVLNSSETITSGNYSTEGISDRVKNNTPEGFTAVKVTTGISNENFIQITDGLSVGDQVYVTESSSSNQQFNFGGPGGMGGMGGGMGGPPGGGNRR